MTMRRMVEDIASVMEWGGRGRGRGYSQDPYLTKAKAAGTDRKGLPYKKGDEIMVYKDGGIYAGANKDQAWREFQAAKDDEAFMSGGMESAESTGPELGEAMVIPTNMSPSNLIRKGDNLIKMLEGAVEEMRKSVKEAQTGLKGYERIGVGGVADRGAQGLLKLHMLVPAQRLKKMADMVAKTIEEGIEAKDWADD